MLTQTVVRQENSLGDLFSRYEQLKLRKDTYNEFDLPVPENVLKELRKLKRLITAQIEMQKDNKRDTLKAQLQATETIEEKRARLKRQLEELGEEN